MNALDTNVTNALDKRAGFTDTLASQISITGSINATTLVSADLNLGIAPHVNDYATHKINLTAQAPDPSAVTNKSTGSINMIFPAPISGGQNGTLNMIDSGNTIMTLQGVNNSGPQLLMSLPYTTTIETTSASANLNIICGKVITLGAFTQWIECYSSTAGMQMGQSANNIDILTGGSIPTIAYTFGVNTSSTLGFVLSYPSITGSGRTTMITGQNSTNSYGGLMQISAGNSSTTSAGTVFITGGLSLGSGTNHGNISIAGGGDSLSGTNTNGGNVFITGGYPTGSGTKGNISLNGNGGLINWAGGSGVVYLGPSTVAPSGYVGNGGVVLWVDSSGNLRCQTSGGNNRLIASV